MAFNKEEGKKVFRTSIPGTEIEIEISPYQAYGYVLHTLELYEELGGKLSSGKLTMSLATTDLIKEAEDLAAIYLWDNLYIAIRDNSKDSYVCHEVYGWVTRKETIDKMLCVEFLVFPYQEGATGLGRDFFTVAKVKTHYIDKNVGGGLKKLIKSLWNGPWQGKNNPDIRCESDIPNNELPDYIWQRGESDYSFLTKILYSYRLNSIFGYSIDGLFIKGLGDNGKNYLGKSDPSDYNNGVFMIQESGISRNFEFKLHLKLLDAFIDDASEYCSRTFDNLYFLFGKSFSKMLENYQLNNIIMKTRLFSSFLGYSTISLPSFKLGDCILYTSSFEKDSNKETIFLNTSNTYFIAGPFSGDRDKNGNIFSVTSLFRGIEDNQDYLFSKSENPNEITDIFGINLWVSNVKNSKK